MPSITSSNSASSTVSGSLTLAIPSSNADDIIVAMVYGKERNAALNDITGTGTRIAIGTAGDVTAALFVFTGGSGNASYDANVVCDFFSVHLIGVSNGNTSSITDDNETGSGSALAHNAGTPASTGADRLLLAFFAGSSDTVTGSFQSINFFNTTTDAADLWNEPGIDQGQIGNLHSGLGIYKYNIPSGSVGSVTAQSDRNLESIGISVLIKPFSGPTAPVFTAPVGGEKITVGTTFVVIWNPSTDPVVAQSALTYQLDYSSNGGTNWTSLTTTAAGAVSYNWNTTGRTPGTNYKLRIRANNGTVNSQYTISNVFEIKADIAPLAPTNLRAEQPAGTILTIIDKAQTTRITYQFNDPGDVQSQHRFEWGTDGVTFGNDSGFLSTTNQYKEYAGSTFSRGQVYFRITTKDNAAQASPSATFNFFAGEVPATPNITAPTNASPPTLATPTITWTSVGQVSYRLRVVLNGLEAFNTGFVQSTLTSVVLGFNFQNNKTYTLYLSIKNVDGFTSLEDSETFTVSYVTPAQPVITVTAVDAGGHVQIQIANSDTPTRNEIYRYRSDQDPEDAIRISANAAVDATFLDYNVPSGYAMNYFVRAVGSNGAVKDSDTKTATLTLSRLWLHVVTKTDLTRNASGTPVMLINLVGQSVLSQSWSRANLRFEGRPKPATVFGAVKQRSLKCVSRITNRVFLRDLQAIFDANSIVCIRDESLPYKDGNLLFGRLSILPRSENPTFVDVEIMVNSSTYNEAV